MNIVSKLENWPRSAPVRPEARLVAEGVLLLAGAALRWPAVWANRFHADEALFATWSKLIYFGDDPLLAAQPVDKPPLLFYAQALFYPFFDGAVPWVARLPGLAVSLLLLALTMRLARALGGDRAGLLAGTLLLFSPLAVQFSATGFTDPLLLALLVASLLAAAENRPVSAGLLWGLAAATKYQAVLFLPLVPAFGYQSATTDRRRLTAAGRFALGAVGPIVAVLLWDLLRGGGIGLWSAQMASYGGLRLSYSWELWPRLGAWLDLGGLLLGRPAWTFGVVALALGGRALRLMGWFDRRSMRQTGPRTAGVLWGFVAAYFFLHWVLAIPAWDRYLLPLVPLVAVAVGVDVAGWTLPAEPVTRRLAAAGLGALLVWGAIVPGWQARSGAWPVGGTPTADHGAHALAAALDSAPWGTVLYDHWYSWQWRYYFLHRPVYVSWFLTPADLADDVAVHAEERLPRYLAWPVSESIAPLDRALDAAGFRLAQREQYGKIDLYQLMRVEGEAP